MSRSVIGLSVFGVLATLVATGAAAGAAGGFGFRDEASDPQAVLLLVEAVRAQRALTYSGTEYVSAWAQGSAATSVVDVDHRAGSGTVIRVRPSIGSTGGEFREPEQVGQPAPIDPLAVSAFESGPLDLLRRNYVLSIGTVRGSTVQVVARRLDGTVAAQFWIDRGSGLPLRREVFDDGGRLVRASAYVSLEIGRADMQASAPPVASTVPGQPIDRTQVVELRKVGWVLPGQLPGGMVLYDVRAQGTGQGLVLHLSYSDGLSTVSVFVEQGRLATHGLSGWTRATMGGPVYVRDIGLGRRVTWTGHGHVYTVVADAPPTSVAALVAWLPHGEHHRGFWGRIRHGLDRLGSWLNPFS